MIPARVTASDPLILPEQHLARVAAQVLDSLPLESCGLMGGTHRRVIEVFPVPNVAKYPESSYLMEPHEQVRVMLLLEARRWELVAIYHSHPPGARSDPSPSDLAQATYPGVPYIIVVPDESGGIASLRAFLLDDPREPVEVPVVVERG